MEIQNNDGCWDLIDDNGNLHYPIDRCDLTDLFTECVAAIIAFKPLLKQIETTQLEKPEEIQMYNLLSMDT